MVTTPRVAVGVPTGGQFAASARPEAAVALGVGARCDRDPSCPMARIGGVVAGDVDSVHGIVVRLAHLPDHPMFDRDRLGLLRAEVREAGAVHQPVTIHVHPDGTEILRDGHHRYLVAQELGLPNIPVDFHIGVRDPETGEVDFPTDPDW